MSVTSWLSLLMVCALGAISPGPSFAVVTRYSLRHSRACGIAAGLAHASGIGLYALLAVTGLIALYQHYTSLQLVLTLAGSLFLLHLAWGIWRSAGQSRLPASAEDQPLSVWIAARHGFLLAFLNPKTGLFFLALFSQLVSPQASTLERVAMAVLAAVVDGSWYTLVAIGFTTPKILAWFEQRLLWIERVMALVLAGLALLVLAKELLT